MSRSTTRTLLFLFLLGSGFQCKHDISRGPSPEGKLTGKLVINAACAHYVIQVLKGHIDSSRIQASWKDPSKDTTYNNVFTVSNVCSFEGANFPIGTVFTFDLDPNPPVQNCMVCMIFYPSPDVKNAVQHVKKTDNL